MPPSGRQWQASAKAVPFAYIARNLWVRPVTTAPTVDGMALVVCGIATVLMTSKGIRTTLVATDQLDNVVIQRRSAGAEISSAASRSQASIIETLPGVASGALGRRLVSKELAVLNSLPKRGDDKPSNAPSSASSAWR